jgi:hypothetical protein
MCFNNNLNQYNDMQGIFCDVTPCNLMVGTNISEERSLKSVTSQQAILQNYRHEKLKNLTQVLGRFPNQNVTLQYYKWLSPARAFEGTSFEGESVDYYGSQYEGRDSYLGLLFCWARSHCRENLQLPSSCPSVCLSVRRTGRTHILEPVLLEGFALNLILDTLNL